MDSELIAKYATENREQAKKAIEKIAQTEEGQTIIKTILNEKDIDRDKIAQAGSILNKAVRNASNNSGGVLSTLSHLDTAVTAPIMAAQAGKYLYDTFGGKPGNKDLVKVLKANPQIKERYDKQEIKEYWNTLRTHAPNLVKDDPKMAGKILEQFLDYEGANIQSLNKVLEAEKKIQENRKSPISSDLNDTIGTLSNTLNKESSPDYESIKEMADERENGD